MKNEMFHDREITSLSINPLVRPCLRFGHHSTGDSPEVRARSSTSVPSPLTPFIGPCTYTTGVLSGENLLSTHMQDDVWPTSEGVIVLYGRQSLAHHNCTDSVLEWGLHSLVNIAAGV